MSLARQALATDEEANLADSQSNVSEKEKLKDKNPSAGEEAQLSSETSETSSDFGKDEQERRIKVTVNAKKGKGINIIEQLYKIINLVLKFDLPDNPNGGTYSLLEAAYLKLKQDNKITLTEYDHISARRLSRMFPIMCVMSFLENSPTDFYADLRDRFIEAVGKSKLSELKPELLDGSYVRAYKCCSEILTENNGGQDIRSIIESICSVHKANLKMLKGWIMKTN